MTRIARKAQHALVRRFLTLESAPGSPQLHVTSSGRLAKNTQLSLGEEAVMALAGKPTRRSLNCAVLHRPWQIHNKSLVYVFQMGEYTCEP